MSAHDDDASPQGTSSDQSADGTSPNGTEEPLTQQQRDAYTILARQRTLVEAAKSYIGRGITTLSNFESVGNPGWGGGDRPGLTADEASRTITSASILYVRGGAVGPTTTFMVVDIDVGDPRAAKVDRLIGWDTTCDQRDTKQRSHLWFFVNDVPPGFTKDATGGNLEVRGDKHNTLAVPSRYSKNDKNEILRFVEGRGLDALKRVPWPEFKARTDYARAVLYLSDRWQLPDTPTRNVSRHDLTVALSGWLIKERWEPERITTLITDVVDMAGDAMRDDFTQAVTDAAARYERKEKLVGYRALVDAWGETDTDQLADWLGIDASRVTFTILSDVDVLLLPDPAWVVHDLLVEATVALMVGPRSSLKSFLALDLAYHIALGRPWRGHDVERGAVLYVAAEGFSGMKKRIEAWRTKYATPPGPVGLDLLGTGVDFFAGGVYGLQTAIEERQADYKLVIIDTLARNKGKAVENSNDEMQVVLHHMEYLAHTTGACLMPIHHVARTAGNERGATSFADGAQTVLRVKRDLVQAQVELAVEKQRDGPELGPIVFVPEEVVLITGKSSLVLVPRPEAAPEAAEREDKTKHLLRDLTVAMDGLRDLVPEGTEGVTRRVWEIHTGLPKDRFVAARDALIKHRVNVDKTDKRAHRYSPKPKDDRE